MVTGVCSNCHTMHNSQAGGEMAYDFSDTMHTFSTTATPKPTLLIYSCVGCHTNVNNADTKVGIVPIVFNPAHVPTDPLAGGNFYYVKQDKANGHNVVGITVADSSFTGKKIPGSATSYNGNQVTCAGAKGCHGNRSESDQLDAMKKAHHTDDDTGGITGGSVGLSYRFLNNVTGVEDDDHEQETDVDKNYYQGANNIDTDTSTISYFCNNCHGDFHDRVDISDESTAKTPWLRHPTDYLLPETGEYGSYNPTTTYENKAPVAWTDPSSPASRTRATAVVMCLSCHRAHGSNYKMLRWDYKSTALSTALSGCGVCHTTKK
jgi:hypothetical protein